jgi:hypothetical protein
MQFTFFHEFKRYLGENVIDLDTHSFKFYLTNAAPNAATHTVKADLAGITTQNGYAEVTITQTWQETGAGTGIWRFAASADITWTASGGSYGPFRYAVLYDDTPSSPADPLVGYIDNGSEVTISDGNLFTLDFDANFSIFTQN